MVQECLPGIYRYSLRSRANGGIGEIQIFLVPGRPGERTLMVDAGFAEPQCLKETEAALAALGITYDRLDVFLTHEHFDHSGLAAILEQRGARIFMNPEEDKHHYSCLYHRRSDDAKKEQTHVLRTDGITPERTPQLWEKYMKETEAESDPDRMQTWVIGDFHYQPVYAGQVFRYGEYLFRSIALRGHTFGQLGLYDEDHRLIFTADQVLNGIVPIVSTSYPDEHLLSAYFKSLTEIKNRFGQWTVLPAHNGRITDMDTQVEHISTGYFNKLEIISDIVNCADHALTVYETACLAYGMKKTPETAPEFMKVKSIVSKTFSCLEYLYEKGFVRRTDQDGILFWSGNRLLCRNVDIEII